MQGGSLWEATLEAALGPATGWDWCMRQGGKFSRGGSLAGAGWAAD